MLSKEIGEEALDSSDDDVEDDYFEHVFANWDRTSAAALLSKLNDHC